MQIDQFRTHGWTPGQSCDYGGTIYPIASVDFAENLVGLENPLCDEGITWVRCENIILHNAIDAAITKAASGCSLSASAGSVVVRPITDRAKEYHAWRYRLSADPTCWQFSDREEAIAFAAFIAGWWLRTGDNPDEFFNPPNVDVEASVPKEHSDTHKTQ
jgi:hypothetical protein